MARPEKSVAGFIFKITVRMVRRAPFKAANRHEALVSIMHAVGEANVFVLPTVFTQ
jgi:hypothetical protein